MQLPGEGLAGPVAVLELGGRGGGRSRDIWRTLRLRLQHHLAVARDPRTYHVLATSVTARRWWE